MLIQKFVCDHVERKRDAKYVDFVSSTGSQPTRQGSWVYIPSRVSLECVADSLVSGSVLDEELVLVGERLVGKDRKDKRPVRERVELWD